MGRRYHLKSKKIIGYTVGTFDMFHIGHLNLLRRIKERCDYLVVGVNSDRLIMKLKNKTPVIPLKDRLAIIDSVKYVDKVIINDGWPYCDFIKSNCDDDKLNMSDDDTFYKETADVLVMGHDKIDDPEWTAISKRANARGAKVVFLPRTKNISSTKLRSTLEEIAEV
jgi:glycerol-3-phosphate cytidylyltransferase